MPSFSATFLTWPPLWFPTGNILVQILNRRTIGPSVAWDDILSCVLSCYLTCNVIHSSFSLFLLLLHKWLLPFVCVCMPGICRSCHWSWVSLKCMIHPVRMMSKYTIYVLSIATEGNPHYQLERMASGASLDALDLPMGAAHSQLKAHVSSPIPDTHFAHQLTVLLHTRGRPFFLVHATYKIGTFQQKPSRSHRRHNCGLQGSAYAHYTRAYLTSIVSATLASLLFLNTAQLPQAAITHWLEDTR